MELLSARFDAFDIKKAVWHMSGNNKTELAIDIPLSTPALNAINELKRNTLNDSEFLFSAGGTKKPLTGHVEESYLNKPLKNIVFPLMGNIENFTIHDLRATMKTHMRSKMLGVDRFVSERCLNHKIAGMEGVYDRGDYFEERKAALELWAAFLDSCENNQEFNVIPFKQKNMKMLG